MQSMRSRLLLSHILPVLITTPVMAIALIYVLETRVILVNLSASLVRQATLIAETASESPTIWRDATAAQAFVIRFQQELTPQLMILDPAGRLLASSDPVDVPSLGQALAIPGLPKAQLGQVSTQINHSQDLQSEVVDVLLPVLDANQRIVGMIRLTQLLVNVQQRFWRLRYLTLSILAGGLTLGLLIGALLAFTLERPLAQLTQAIHRLSSGQDRTSLSEQGPAEIRQLVRTFNTLVDRLRTLEEAQQHLLANLVHEIRRPLGALQAAVHALLNGASDEVALRTELLTGMQAELARLHHLMDELALLHEQALGVPKLELRPVILQEWLSIVITPWREAAQSKGLVWQATLPDPTITLVIDPDRLAQALGNLLSNAVKYTPVGGMVAVTTAVIENHIYLQVSDTGPGISPQEQAQIFAPLFQRSTSRRSPQGMGIGLTIAHDLVVAHGGQLEVESTPGKGSCFTIRLPLQTGNPPQ